MNYQPWIMGINVVILIADIILIYLLFKAVVRNTGDVPLFKPTESMLKPWSKKEKRKPKANDDSAAWKKENNIE